MHAQSQTVSHPERHSQRIRTSAGGSPNVLDWRNLPVTPEPMNLASMVVATSLSGSSRFAVLVNSHPMLRAASVFAEQAGLHGIQVRVFIDEDEAVSWVEKGAGKT